MAACSKTRALTTRCRAAWARELAFDRFDRTLRFKRVKRQADEQSARCPAMNIQHKPIEMG